MGGRGIWIGRGRGGAAGDVSDQVDAGGSSSPKNVAPKPPVGVSRAQSGSEGGAGPASRARCQPSEPSERPRRNNGSRRSSESRLPDAARTQASAAPKFGEGGGARGFREPNELAGDGVAIGAGGGGCSVAFLKV